MNRLFNNELICLGQKFAAAIGIDSTRRSPVPELSPEKVQAAKNNRESFFKYDAGAVAHSTLDIDALRAAPTRILLAGGSDSHAYFPYIVAARLAERMGTKLIEFPGDHGAFAGHPAEFAARLAEVLGPAAWHSISVGAAPS